MKKDFPPITPKPETSEEMVYSADMTLQLFFLSISIFTNKILKLV